MDYIEKYKDIRNVSGFDYSMEKGKKVNEEILRTLVFNENTRWGILENCNPQNLLEKCKNPGLGIKELHNKGIDGRGINVAIIDQPALLDHPEYNSKIIEYKDFNTDNVSSMHGPAVLSLLVGDNIGTAPGSKVYYCSAPSWKRDAKYEVDALNWIIEKNKTLSQDEKIRVVSVSAAPSYSGTRDKNTELWIPAVERALDNNILVLDCTSENGFISPAYYDIDNINKIENVKFGFLNKDKKIENIKDKIFVPCSHRTVAEYYEGSEPSYTYCGLGGLSWSIPYVAGVLALGWQINPSITASEMRDIVLSSSYSKNGNNIIYPLNFIENVKEYKNSKTK